MVIYMDINNYMYAQFWSECLRVLRVYTGQEGAQESWESKVEQSPSTHPLETPVEVVTYDESASGHVAPVSAESAQAAFKEACATSMKRQEDVTHPEMHVGKSGGSHESALLSTLPNSNHHQRWHLFWPYNSVMWRVQKHS